MEGRAFFQVRVHEECGKLLIPARVMEINQLRIVCCSLRETNPILPRFCQRDGTACCEVESLERSHPVPNALPSWDQYQVTAQLSLVTIRAASSHGAVVRGKALACS